ncbi:hypothetical protein SODALDRAFT_294130 [Sodiomyces alkalinus F11]|uniref:DUF7924 domain-containing protein n=1 Tax=Sodiomyces alkalinus (strain CBS 110278 / VKM F-3762 / F11) TaxID=1314773 RepID=A0A3N2PWR2_SODAK|nr:hypothetical protein SODALDRAFT_294130 [Sodiomyces alkalinus F11]ROT38963.1 hypothetical protein SODALDRAFT_294130 [Sodiomyces alkalinus F11]
MVHTRAQLAAQQGDISTTQDFQGEPPPKDVGMHISHSRIWQPAAQHAQCPQPYPSSTEKTLLQHHSHRGTKRPADARHHDPEPVEKRPRLSPTDPLVEETQTSTKLNPIAHWAREGHWPREEQWPQEYIDLGMEHMLARKRSLRSLSRKRSNSASSMTPSDQRPREEKSAPYRDNRYDILLETKGVYLVASDEGITDTSKRLVQTLLDGEQPIPRETIFDDAVFLDACRNLGGQNEVRIIQDISRLVVPSAETLALRAIHLRPLVESVNAGWNNSIPLTGTGTRPQPDYAVGFRRRAFTDDQLTKLSPFIGDLVDGDLSFFMATYFMYFPFLTCEVKCGAVGLDIADRQNAHSMALAVRAVVELFRAVKREAKIHRQILAFSVSHDHSSVRIYGHYAEINGNNTAYYRHAIYKFDFTTLDGKEKWTTYRFVKNVYDVWAPTHFEMICSAINQLPAELNFDVPSLPDTGLSKDLGSSRQSDVGSASRLVEQVNQSSNTGQVQAATPGTSIIDPQATKKRRE